MNVDRAGSLVPSTAMAADRPSLTAEANIGMAPGEDGEVNPAIPYASHRQTKLISAITHTKASSPGRLTVFADSGNTGSRSDTGSFWDEEG